MQSDVQLGEIASASLPQVVPYAVLKPPDYDDFLPLCIVLMGGGGSRQTLIDCQPMFDRWWAEGSVSPMVLATPGAGMSYYLDWDFFLAEEFLPHLRRTLNVGTGRELTAIAGMSMGGYGALKVAFSRPELFGAVAAVHPLLEPAFHENAVGHRNRLHHSAGGPPQLIGESRDPAVVEANNPANRVRDNCARIRESGLAIYIEAGDNDFINAHDGVEFLHRVLWDRDISHEYRLIRNADHGGPTFIPRLRDAFQWVGGVLTQLRSPAPKEPDDIRALRAQLQPIRERAAGIDPNVRRRYGVLPPSS